MKKRGFEIATSTIILIVLSVAVLVILLFVLNSQTGFFSKFLSSQTSESTIDPFISNCNSLVASGSSYTYCCEFKKVKFVSENETKTVKVTCSGAQNYNWSEGRLEGFECSSVNCEG